MARERKKKDATTAEAPELAPTNGTPPGDAPPAAKAKKAKKPSKEELLVQWVSHREEGKRHYEAADLALQELLKKVKPGKVVKHPVTGEEFTMTDNYAAKNTVFGLAGVKRFELKPVKGTKRTPVPTETPPTAAPAADAEPTA